MELDQHYASTAQVADALGLGVTTVKRWIDEGILPARRTAGGHRKVLMADVLRVVREAGLPIGDISKLLPAARAVDLSTLPNICRQLHEALAAADVELARTLISGAHARGHLMHAIADEIVGPALVEVGNQWEIGRISVMHEHRAIQILLSALYELKAALLAKVMPGLPIAVGGAPAGDPTLVPTLLAKLTLLDCGWEAINLGADTPASAFVTAMDELEPSLIWLCATHLEQSDRFLTEFREIHRAAEERCIPIAVGGRGLTKEIREKMAYTTFGDGMGHLAAFARTLHQRPTVPKRGRPRKRNGSAERY